MLLGACLAGVALLGTWGSLQWAPKWSIALAKLLPADGGPYYAKEFTQIASASGAIVGAIIAALLGRLVGPSNHVFRIVHRFVHLARLSVPRQ